MKKSRILVATSAAIGALLLSATTTACQNPFNSNATSTTSTGTSGSPTTETQKSTSTPKPTTTANNSSSGVLKETSAVMKDTEFVDLESGRVGGPGKDEFYMNGDEVVGTGRTTAVATGKLSRQECVDLLSTRQGAGLDLKKLKNGSYVCVETFEGNIAQLRITSLPSPGNRELAFSYTVWK